jgi:AcrR family transcriptional regulator
MARKTKDDTEKTYEILLDSAEEIFLEKGVAAASLEEIAKRAGLTRGALYWHFENKADLLSAVHKRAKAPLDAMYEHALQEGKDPLEVLKESTTHCLQLLATDQRMRNMFTICMFRCENFDPPHEIGIYLSQKRFDCLSRFAEAFAEAYEEGRLVEELTPEKAALGLHAYLTGIFSDYLRYPKLRDLYHWAPTLIGIYFKGVMR